MKPSQPRDSEGESFGGEEVRKKKRMLGLGKDLEEIANDGELGRRELTDEEKPGFAVDLAEGADRRGRKARDLGGFSLGRERHQDIEEIAGELVGEGVLVDLKSEDFFKDIAADFEPLEGGRKRRDNGQERNDLFRPRAFEKSGEVAAPGFFFKLEGAEKTVDLGEPRERSRPLERIF